MQWLDHGSKNSKQKPCSGERLWAAQSAPERQKQSRGYKQYEREAYVPKSVLHADLRKGRRQSSKMIQKRGVTDAEESIGTAALRRGSQKVSKSIHVVKESIEKK